jgi:membrane protease YdiL (CAAX protease family)
LTGVENITLWVRGSWDYREVADVISHALTYVVALLLVYLHVTRLERRRFWGSVGVRRENFRSSIVWVFALSVVFTAILYFYWQGVRVLTGADPQQEIRGFFGGSEDWYFAYLAFAFFFPVAFTEELVFRGFMIERFLVKGSFAAIGLSSLLFASLHLWYVSFGVVALSLYGGLFLVAVWWGIVYYKTRNILGLVIFHGLFNLWMVVEHFWSAQGRAVLESAIFVFGVVCLGYLVFLYLKGLFREIEELMKKKK